MMQSQVNRRAIITAVVLLAMWTAGLCPGRAADDAAGLAPKGELRVALVTSNAALVTRDADGQFRGVAIDLANALAAKLGVPSRVVPYENQTRFNLSLGKDEWDIAVGPRDLSRTGQLAFSNVFMEADNGYVAKLGVSLRTAQEVDRAGVKVAVAQGSALDGFLTRTLKNAEIIRVPPGLAAARESLSFGRADVFADNVPQAYRIAAEVAGATVLLGRFNVAQITIAIPKSSIAALPMLNDFLADAKRDGLIGDAIKHAALRGVRATR
jgi:polar amino acid transport system substrate-binding protein